MMGVHLYLFRISQKPFFVAQSYVYSFCIVSDCVKIRHMCVININVVCAYTYFA